MRSHKPKKSEPGTSKDGTPKAQVIVTSVPRVEANKGGVHPGVAALRRSKGPPKRRTQGHTYGGDPKGPKVYVTGSTGTAHKKGSRGGANEAQGPPKGVTRT